MAKFSFPSCCLSCTCFSSPSQRPAVNSLCFVNNRLYDGLYLAAKPSQFLSSIRPYSPSPYLFLTSQSLTTHQLVKTFSSQPSQQPANTGPSSATNTDLESFLQKFNDISQLQDLIHFIEELLKIASGEKSEEGSTSAVTSYIQDGLKVLDFVDKHFGRSPEKKDSMDGASSKIQTIVTNLLKGAGKIHWVGAALSVVGFVLSRYGDMSNNQRECLELLKRMFNLGKQIVKLNEQIPEQKQKLNEPVECIVAGCSMCASQITTAKIFRFLTASVNADGLKAFQAKIDSLNIDLILSGIIDIEERLPKNAPQSPELFENESAVGIESARDEVIRLLDLNAQHESPQVVVVHGFGGIGKTTVADAVYAKVDLKTYKHCRIHMDQNCTKNDLKVLQEQILKGLFDKNVKLPDCDHGRGMIRSLSKKNPNRSLFLYIDNGLKKTDLKEVLPADLGSWLPPNSRILVTTRNLQETEIFVDRNIQRLQYAVSPLPPTEARKILLKKVWEYNDENNIKALLKLCGGIPLVLEIASSQLALSTKTTNNIILEMIAEGENVEVEDISDRLVDFVYDRLLPRVKEAFLDIASFFCRGTDRFYHSKFVAYWVGEEEFRALEEASFVKTIEYIFGSVVTVHDIVRARGKKMSEQNRITDRESLLECLKDEEKLKNLKGIYFDQNEEYEQAPIEINENHLNCMSNSLRVLNYGLQIIFTGKCHKPFKQLRFLYIPRDIPDLPMEFDKLEHLTTYWGPWRQGMSLYKLPPTLRFMYIRGFFENGVTHSEIPSKVTPSSLVRLYFDCTKNTEKVLDGVERLLKLEKLVLSSYTLMELPFKFGDLSNLKVLLLINCGRLKKLPSDFGRLKNLEELDLSYCSNLEEWPLNFGDLSNLKELSLQNCDRLKELPSDFGQLKNLEKLNLSGCSTLEKLPLSFGNLSNLKELLLSNCDRLKELPSDFGRLKNLEELDLSDCSSLEEWPLSFGDLSKLKQLTFFGCSSKLKESLPQNIREKCEIYG